MAVVGTSGDGTQHCVMKVGIWNGAQTGNRGKLLFRAVMDEALAHGFRGGTVWAGIEGSRANRNIRSVESEVTSNQLPVWLEFVDVHERILTFLPRLRTIIGNHGFCVTHPVHLGNDISFNKRGEDASMTKTSNPSARHSTNQATKYVNEPGKQSSTDGSTGSEGTPGLQVQIYMLEKTKIQGKPAYQAVSEFLRQRKIHWVSTTRCVGGFGEQRQMRKTRFILSRSDTPLVMFIVDSRDKLAPYLPELVDFVGSKGLVVSYPVQWNQ